MRQRRLSGVARAFIYVIYLAFRGVSAGAPRAGSMCDVAGPRGAGAPRRAPPRTVARSGRGSGAGAAAGTEVEVGSRRGGLHSKSGAPRALTTRPRRERRERRDATRRSSVFLGGERDRTATRAREHVPPRVVRVVG